MARHMNRAENELRKVEIKINTNKHAEGSCTITCGDTVVMCTASVEEKVPGWLKNSGKGWVTAEYGMLPRATGVRVDREAKKGQSGRTHEIQRLIGRALRAGVDLEKMDGVSIKVDCDVIQADGGTRTASITGGFVALCLALQKLADAGKLKKTPVKHFVAAVSCGVVAGVPSLDLDYLEDSTAETDANFVMLDNGHLVEIQATAENGASFKEEEFAALLALAKKGILELIEVQKGVVQK